MKTSYVFFANGFEEIEALTVVDVLRRAGMPVVTVSIGETTLVEGAHGVTVQADSLYADNSYAEADWLILPGGMPGASNLAAHQELCAELMNHNRKGGHVAAICASPAIVLAPLGIITGRNAVCYPGMDRNVSGVKWRFKPVAVCENVVTGNSPSAAAAFALALVEQSAGKQVADEVAHAMLLFNDED